MRNDHKPLARFLNGKNENTKINRWGLKLTSYNITFEWISGARNKAADCPSRLVELPEKHQKNQTGTKPTWINMSRAVTTRSRLKQPEIDKETKKPRPKKQTQTMTPQEMKALITQGTHQYGICNQLTLSVDVS